MSNEILKIGITGHISIVDHEYVKKHIDIAIGQILYDSKANVFEAYSGMAMGTDTLFAQLALEKYKQPLHAILAYDEGDFVSRFNNPRWEQVTNSLLQLAKSKVVVCPDIDANDKEQRGTAYSKTGQFIVDHCDILISVWDGQSAKGKGGTAEVIEYAKSIGKEIKFVKARMPEFSLEAMVNAKKERSDVAPSLKKWYSFYWFMSLIFLLLTAWCLSYIICNDCKGEDLYKMSLWEGAMFVCAFIFILFANSKSRKKKRLNNRFEAEALRYMIPLIKAGVPLRQVISIRNSKSIDYELDIDESIIEMEECYISNKAIQNIVEAKKILKEELLEVQLKFHQKRERKEEYKLKIVEVINLILTLLFILGIVLHLVYAGIGKEWITSINNFKSMIHHWGLALTLYIPPLYAATEAFKYFQELEKFIGESINYRIYLEQQITYLDDTNFTSDELISFANKIREVLTLENRNWYLLMMHKERGSVA